MERTSRLFRERKWQRDSAKGLWHFALVRGMLGWGVPMFALMGLLFPLISHRPHAFELRTLLIHAAIWPLGGLLWGLLTWWFMAWRLRKVGHNQGVSGEE